MRRVKRFHGRGKLNMLCGKTRKNRGIVSAKVESSAGLVAQSVVGIRPEFFWKKQVRRSPGSMAEPSEIGVFFLRFLRKSVTPTEDKGPADDWVMSADIFLDWSLSASPNAGLPRGKTSAAKWMQWLFLSTAGNYCDFYIFATEWRIFMLGRCRACRCFDKRNAFLFHALERKDKDIIVSSKMNVQDIKL